MEKLRVRWSIVLSTLFLSGLFALPGAASTASRIISMPALGVQGEGQPGVVNYILIQLDRVAQEDGPTVEFNEVNLGGGSLVGDDWKEGVRHAVQAVIHAVGDPGRDWLITVKNRSATSITDGKSASAVVAVGLMALYRGDAIRSDVILSGQVTSDGRLDVVGGLPVKIEAAAGAHYRTVVVAQDQIHTPDWEVANDVAAKKRMQLVQAATLEDAYQVMVGQSH